MSHPGTGEEPPWRALLVAVVAMAGVAMLVGLAIGGAALSVVKLTGVGKTPAAVETAEETLVMPRYRPTDGSKREEPQERLTPSRSPDKKPTPEPDPITLVAAPARVSAGERINLSGAYRGGDGAVLQVQRKENGQWVDFPVTVTVQGGDFVTWIQTSRTGRSEFRVYDKAGRKGSGIAVVTVG